MPTEQGLELWGVRQHAATALRRLKWSPRDKAEKTRYFIAHGEWDKLPDLGDQAVELLVAEVATALVALYDKNPEGFVRHSTLPEARFVEQIGRKIDAAGGFELMPDVHGRFAQSRRLYARNLEIMWDCIGKWLL